MLSRTLFNLEISARAALSTRRRQPRRPLAGGPTDLFLCVTDHYEPHVGAPEAGLARARHEDWLNRYPQVARGHRDADGCPPAHTFCYPWDEHDPWELRTLADLCAAGWGEIELHLHHQDDTEATLRQKLREGIQTYHRAGALSVWPDGRPAFGFVHGNWALDNSRQEGGRNYCGVNNELTVLQEEGCYADFTFPAWQHTAQPRKVNSIYYAIDDPGRPKSYDSGRSARVGGGNREGLLLVQGPLVPYWARAKRGGRIAMDDGDLAACRRYEPARLDRWVKAGVHVAGRPDRVFIKLHCHGAADGNRAALLGGDLEALFTDAEGRYNDGTRFRLHYVTAREMFNVIRATEDGAEDGPHLRDWVLPPPGALARTPGQGWPLRLWERPDPVRW